MAVSALEPHRGPLVVADLQGSDRRRRKEAVIRALFFTAAAVSVLISALIVVSLGREAFSFITGVDLASLNSIGWFPRRGLYDISTLVVGTLLVTAIAMLVAVPVGLGAAVYLSEYARPRVRRFLKPIVEVLAGIPSVVLGFFALTWISPNLVQRFFSDAQQFNLLAAGIGVGILTVPLMASISEDALRSVPGSLREASAGVDVCREMRRRSKVPIIMVTAKSSEVDTVVGLEVGADDYVTKPYRLRELVARMRSVLRRAEERAVVAAPSDEAPLVVADVRLDPARHEVTVRGDVVELPLKEFAVLEMLLDRAGRVVTRDALIDGVWGHDYVGDTKTLDVHIKRLRAKVETEPSHPERILTVRGVGYKYAVAE
jgi:DNA-binding response OmpR family regulator